MSATSSSISWTCICMMSLCTLIITCYISNWRMYGRSNILYLWNQMICSIWCIFNKEKWICDVLCIWRIKYIISLDTFANSLVATMSMFHKMPWKIVLPTYKLSGKGLAVGIGLNCGQRFNCRHSIPFGYTITVGKTFTDCSYRDCF